MDITGLILRRARQRARVSQSTVAREMGVDQSTVSRWETGEYSPAFAILPRLAKIYGTTATALITELERWI